MNVLREFSRTLPFFAHKHDLDIQAFLDKPFPILFLNTIPTYDIRQAPGFDVGLHGSHRRHRFPKMLIKEANEVSWRGACRGSIDQLDG